MARWLVLELPRSADDPDRVAALLALGGSAVEEDGEILRTWIDWPADPDAFLEEASAALGAGAGELAWRAAEDRDWLAEWRKGLGPRRIGRVVVTPTWVEPERRPGDVVIALDPQMAFGTGEHATTRLMLALMQTRVRRGARVLDVGSGSGILAIAADLLGAGEVIAAESDGEALPNARENIERNEAGHVRLEHALIDAAWLAAAGTFDVIVANVLSGVLQPLLGPFRAALRPGGALLLGGILGEEAEAMRAAAAAADLVVDEERVEDEWWSVALTS